MIRKDAEIGFDIPVPEGCNFVEVSMPSAVMRAYQQARQAHPNAAYLPPMRIVERGTTEHFIAVLNGGVVYVKEDPLNPTVIDDGAPDHIKVMCQSDTSTKQK